MKTHNFIPGADGGRECKTCGASKAAHAISGSNVLEYTCGCRIPTAEPSQIYDHACADCFKAATKGKRY